MQKWYYPPLLRQTLKLLLTFSSKYMPLIKLPATMSLMLEAILSVSVWRDQHFKPLCTVERAHEWTDRILWFTHIGVKLGTVVLVVIRAVHGSVSHGDDPWTHCSVLWLVGLLERRKACTCKCVWHWNRRTEVILFGTDWVIGRFIMEKERMERLGKITLC